MTTTDALSTAPVAVAVRAPAPGPRRRIRSHGSPARLSRCDRRRRRGPCACRIRQDVAGGDLGGERWPAQSSGPTSSQPTTIRGRWSSCSVTLLRTVADADLGTSCSASGPPPRSTRLTVGPVLAHAVSRCEQPFVLVLDDIHVIEDGVAADLIGVLLQQRAHREIDGGDHRAPRTERARSARLRADGRRRVTITADELALTVPEAWAVFASIGVGLDEDEVRRVPRGGGRGGRSASGSAALTLREGAGQGGGHADGPARA